jgi:fructosamine-3-kinase
MFLNLSKLVQTVSSIHHLYFIFSNHGHLWEKNYPFGQNLNGLPLLEPSEHGGNQEAELISSETGLFTNLS